VSVPQVGVGQKARERDPPEVALRRDLQNRRPAAIALQMRLLSGHDVRAFLVGQRRVFGRGFIEQQPEDDPAEAEAAGDHECGLPVVSQDRPRDERRRQHRPDRSADVEDAAGEGALLGREPLGRGLHPGRVRRSLCETEQSAQSGQGLPTMRQPVRHADERPGDRENRESNLQAEDIEHVPGNRLQHDRELKGGDDP
jgi:hypothetical protein